MKIYLYVFIFLFLLLPLFPADEDEPLQITDTRESFSIAVIAAESEDLPVQTEYLIEKLKEHISLSIVELDIHEYSDEELQLYAQILKEKSILERKKKLSSLYIQRDEGYLYGNIDTAEKTIEEIETVRHETERINSSQNIVYSIPFEKEITVKETAYKGSEIPDKDFMLQEVLDFAVYFSAFTVDDLFGIQLYVVNFNGESEFIGKEIGSIEQIFTQIEEHTFNIMDKIRGFRTVRAVIRATPDDAVISLNNSVVGTGIYAGNLRPGEYSLSVTRAGYEPYNGEIELSQQILEQNITLTQMPSMRYVIQTIPSGASVYADSRPLGETPLFLYTHNSFQLLQLQYKGYESSSYLIDDATPDKITIQLRPDYKDREEVFERKKWNFYRSFSSFLLSVPVTLFLNNYRNAFASEYENFRYEYEATTISMYGSIYLNFVLFAQTVISLREYIQIGNETIRGEFGGLR